MPICAGLLEPRRSELVLLKSMFNAENFIIMQVILVYLQPFSRNSVLKCALHPKIVKNSLKTPFLKVQGHSRSSMLINLKSLSPVLVMISSMSVPIRNHFHTIRANNNKITSFRGYPSLTPSFEGNPHTHGH